MFEELKTFFFFFINAFLSWTISIDFNGLNLHNFLASLSSSGWASLLYTSNVLVLHLLMKNYYL